MICVSPRSQGRNPGLLRYGRELPPTEERKKDIATSMASAGGHEVCFDPRVIFPAVEPIALQLSPLPERSLALVSFDLYRRPGQAFV